MPAPAAAVFLILSIVTAIVLPAGAARAVECSALPNPVYLQIGDTQEPMGVSIRWSLVSRMQREPTTTVIAQIAMG